MASMDRGRPPWQGTAGIGIDVVAASVDQMFMAFGGAPIGTDIVDQTAGEERPAPLCSAKCAVAFACACDEESIFSEVNKETDGKLCVAACAGTGAMQFATGASGRCEAGNSSSAGPEGNDAVEGADDEEMNPNADNFVIGSLVASAAGENGSKTVAVAVALGIMGEDGVAHAGSTVTSPSKRPPGVGVGSLFETLIRASSPPKRSAIGGGAWRVPASRYVGGWGLGQVSC